MQLHRPQRRTAPLCRATGTMRDGRSLFQRRPVDPAVRDAMRRIVQRHPQRLLATLWRHCDNAIIRSHDIALADRSPRNFLHCVDERAMTQLLLDAANNMRGDAIATWAEMYDYYDGLAQCAGYRTFEEYLMFTFGYAVSSVLPRPMRRHVDPRMAFLEARSLERQMVLAERAKANIERGIGSIAEATAQWMEELACEFSAWRGELRIEDLDGLAWGALAARRLKLFQRAMARACQQQIFPRWWVRDVATLRCQLVRYRAAERLVYGGVTCDRDNDTRIHCFASSSASTHLMTMLGLEAFTVQCDRLTMGDPVDDLLIGGWVKDLSASCGVHPGVVLFLLNHLALCRRALSDESAFSRIGAETMHAIDPSTVRRVVDSYDSLHPTIQNTMRAGKRTDHFMTAARIEGTWYLIDLNGQQFGPEYDHVVLIPLTEAEEHGIFLIPAALEILHADDPIQRAAQEVEDMSFLAAAYSADVEARQYVIARYMQLQRIYWQ